MSTWDDKPNDYEHALKIIERLRAALRAANRKPPMDSILTKRPISHDEAQEAMQRLVNSHFNNNRETHEHGRMSIPANPDRDDDLVLSAYIKQQRERTAAYDADRARYFQEKYGRLRQATREMLRVSGLAVLADNLNKFTAILNETNE